MRRNALLVLLALSATLLTAQWIAPDATREAILQPLAILFGAQRRMNSTLLEVSETGEPVAAATRRLLQPLGVVSLIRTFPEAPPSPAPVKTPDASVN